MRRNLLSYVFGLTFAFAPACGPIMAAEEMLTIGSRAPAINIEHWVSHGKDRFKSVNQFDKDKVYVVEFWATWCPPCIQSMPHLADVQDKYADKDVQIISVSDEELEIVEGFLSKKVKGSNDKDRPTYAELTSRYCLTTDPDRSVHEEYMTAAGQGGIPCAFIVGKTGLIEWIGHPMEMDEPLQQVVEGKWDREAFAEPFKKSQRIEFLQAKIREMSKEQALKAIAELKVEYGGDPDILSQLEALDFQVDMRDLGPLMRKKDVDGILAFLEQMDSRYPKMADQIVGTRLGILAQNKEYAKMGTALENAAKSDNGMMLNAMAWNSYEMMKSLDNPQPALLKGAMAAAEKAAKVMPESGHILDTLAHIVHLSGDLDRALEIQAKAVQCEDGGEESIKEFLVQLKKEKESKK